MRVMKRSLILCTLFFFIIASQLYAGIHGTGMGGIKSVTSEGPGDISRNPALLGTMTADKAFSLFAIARAYTLYNIEADINTSLTPNITDVDVDDPLHLGGSVLAAYAFKAGSSTYGVSLEGYEGNLGSHETGERTLHYDTGNSSESKTKKTTISPAINMAMGWHTGNNSFMGLQVILGNKLILEEEKDSLDSKTENVTQLHSLELGFGYTKRTEKSEIGVLLRSGTFTLEKKSMDKEFDALESDSNSTEFWPKYDKGLQLLTGAYTLITEKTGFGIEFGYRFPVTFVDKSLNADDTAKTVSENTTPISTRSSVTLKGGFEFFLDDATSMNTGIGYESYEISGRKDGSVVDLSLSVLSWIIGYNHMLSPGSELSLVIITYRQKGESFIRVEEGSAYYQLKGKDTRYAFEIGGGITRTF